LGNCTQDAISGVLLNIRAVPRATLVCGKLPIVVARQKGSKTGCDTFVYCIFTFIRLRLNTLQLAAGMKGVATRRSPQGRRRVISYGEFRFDTPQLAAGSFIFLLYNIIFSAFSEIKIVILSGRAKKACGYALIVKFKKR